MMTLYHCQQQCKCKTPLREKQTVLWQRCMMSFTKWDVINLVSSKKDAIKIAEQCNLLHHQSVAFLVAGYPNHFETSRLDRFASWFRAKRAVAACLRLKRCLKKGKKSERVRPACYQPVNVEEIGRAEKEIIIIIKRLSLIHIWRCRRS